MKIKGHFQLLVQVVEGADLKKEIKDDFVDYIPNNCAENNGPTSRDHGHAADGWALFQYLGFSHYDDNTASSLYGEFIYR